MDSVTDKTILMNTYNSMLLWRNSINIGIKHDFLCINICWAPKEVFKTEPESRGFHGPEAGVERRGFQHFPRGPANVTVSEKHF